MVRSDYILYVVGVAFFIVVGYALLTAESLEAPMLIYSAIVFVLALFGITAFIFGYGLRPKKQKTPPVTPPLAAPPLPAVESPKDLTQVKGIGEKRAEQLKALGINTVADLSAASAEEWQRN